MALEHRALPPFLSAHPEFENGVFQEHAVACDINQLAGEERCLDARDVRLGAKVVFLKHGLRAKVGVHALANGADEVQLIG